MSVITIICIILLVIMFVMQINHVRSRKNISEQLVDLVKNKKYSQLYKRVENADVTRYIPEFNRNFLCFNAAMIENNQSKINEYFDKLSQLKMNVQQLKLVYMKGLQYFVASQDTKRCEVCYKALITLDMDVQSKEYLEKINAIVLKKDTNKLNELLEAINTNSDNDKFIDEYLVAQIYKNLGNQAEYDRYSIYAKKHLDLYIKQASNN